MGLMPHSRHRPFFSKQAKSKMIVAVWREIPVSLIIETEKGTTKAHTYAIA
jgi:hypothetical protein